MVGIRGNHFVMGTPAKCLPVRVILFRLDIEHGHRLVYTIIVFDRYGCYFRYRAARGSWSEVASC